MRISFKSLALLFSAVIMLSACLSDDNDNTEYTYSNETGISAFTLGTMNRYLHTVSSADSDSIYKVTYAGSNYKMTIDQLGRRIYNPDSLPYGTDLEHVVATITAIDNGIILLKAVDSDTLTYYSSSDSIDFSTPRTIRIVAQNGQQYADYTVTLNARVVPENTMNWQTKAESSEIAALVDIKAVAAGKRIYVFGTEDGHIAGYSANVNDGSQWTRLAATIPAGASIVSCDSILYMLSGGQVYSSNDGQAWQSVGTDSRLMMLVAASTKRLYAITYGEGGEGQVPGGIAVSADGGATWTPDSIDYNALLLPTIQTGYTCIPVQTNDSIDQVMITGYCYSVNDVVARTWTRLDDYSSHPVDAEWNYVYTNPTYPLKELPTLAVTVYGGSAVALGNNGSTVSALLRSRDGGITWKDSELALPDSLSAETGKLTMTSDAEGSLWIISGGTVWKN